MIEGKYTVKCSLSLMCCPSSSVLPVQGELMMDFSYISIPLSCILVGQVCHRDTLPGCICPHDGSEAKMRLRNQAFQGAVGGETNQGHEFAVFAIWSVFVGQEKINVNPTKLLASFLSHRRVPEWLVTMLTVLQRPRLKGVWYLSYFIFLRWLYDI